MSNPFKNEIVGAKSLHRAKQPPELQFHCAATLVSAGDLTSKIPEERRDKEGELCQFQVTLPPQFVGKVKRHTVEEAFHNMCQAVLQKLRAHGVMDGGE